MCDPQLNSTQLVVRFVLVYQISDAVRFVCVVDGLFGTLDFMHRGTVRYWYYKGNYDTFYESRKEAKLALQRQYNLPPNF